jgi:hypothetical protein
MLKISFYILGCFGGSGSINSIFYFGIIYFWGFLFLGTIGCSFISSSGTKD